MRTIAIIHGQWSLERPPLRRGTLQNALRTCVGANVYPMFELDSVTLSWRWWNPRTVEKFFVEARRTQMLGNKGRVLYIKEVTDDIPLRCVKCGSVLNQTDRDDTIASGWAPACSACMIEVGKEMSNHFGMWPADWYGHAFETSFHVWKVFLE